MFIDARSLSPDSTIAADVCVVGTGPAGITLALGLKNSGLDVILVESGGLELDEKIQSLSAGKVIGVPYGPIQSTRVRAFGGTAREWESIIENRAYAHMRPLDEADFIKREWVPYSGWPFGSNELHAYYSMANEICGIGPSRYSVEDEEVNEGNSLLSQLDSTCLQPAVFHFGANTQFLTAHKSALEEVNNTNLYYYASVTNIETNESNSRVVGVTIRAPSGASWLVRAKTFVLACGGIENARLLLASKSGHGIGNENNLVGRFFMEHPHGPTGFLIPAEPYNAKRLSLYSLHKNLKGAWSRWHLALSDQQLRNEQLLRYNVALWPTEPEWMPDDLAGLARRQLERYKDSAQAPQFYAISFMSEQAPNPASRVTLSDQIGEDGVNLPCLNWQLSEIDFRTLIRGQQIIQEELQLAGVGVVYTKQYSDAYGGFLKPRWGGYEARIEGAHHHMGTTRMHDDPKQGVVDANCRVHGMENLFIAGCSVFPTGGYANPTLTIVALAARLADHIKNLSQARLN
ncbi:MAG: GMC family oxidoreductase [Nodosilinea sp. WJT8-NPBG4]|jgi:choline dehydrogenase-like flavoprotein|nr:GMC family oxidoreductase [Nodosilinea sp. WJT8-NPBG4]